MPLIEYISRRFSAESQRIIDHAVEISDDYRSQGYTLTLRQLYYQFVARDLIKNDQKEYKRPWLYHQRCPSRWTARLGDDRRSHAQP